MLSDVTSSSTGVPVIPSSDLPTVEEVKGYSAEKLNEFLKGRLSNIDNHINTLTAQELGPTFLDLTRDDLLSIQIPLGPAKRIVKLINDIKGGIGSLTASIARLQLQDKEIWVRYNDECVSLPENVLEVLKVSNVGDLKGTIKNRFKLSEDITIRSGSGNLEDSKLVNELYNTEANALEVIVEGNDDESKEKEMGIEESNIEVKRIENAFHVNYQGSALNTFYERLVLFHNEWRDGNRPYAPYLTIIQSSGSGKTRLVGELRTKGVYVLYICKRQMNSSGYPASTPYVQQIFEKIRDNKFGVLLSEAIKLIKKNNWNEEQFWELQVKVEHGNTRAQFWERVLESAESLSQPNNFLSNKNFVKDFFDEDKPISVVCCIDEAHELLERTSISNDETYFVRWRRQIRNIMWHGFFNILLSTNGKIGNFLPPEIKDTHSARMHEYFLFPAYLDVHTIDALARLAPTGKLYVPQRTLYLGIPLWGSLAQAGVDLTNVLHLASQKIRNFNKKQEKDYLANLACMSCSFALEVSPRIAEVEMLIASHMATAIGVSDDRTDLLCTYPSDPILASGALKGIIEVGLEDCLDTLLEQFSRGVVEAGERGELVGRILFLEAYIRAVKKNQKPPYTYLEKVPLPLFLKALCKGIDEKLDNLLAKMKLDQAEIGFNHWTSLLASNKDYVKEGGHKHLTATLVKDAYHRHTAFKMPLGFPVIDHVIPFQYPTDNSTNNYGIISIQNKNAKTTKYQDSDVPVLVNPVSAFDRNNFNGIILGIYIDVGTSNASIEIKEVQSVRTRSMNENVYNRAIYIQHIQSFNCEKEIGERLSKLLFTTPWPLDTRWSMIIKEKPLDRKKAIKSFLPLVFKQERSLTNCWHL